MQHTNAIEKIEELKLPPQQMVFDLRVGNKLYGSVPVVYTDEWVEFTSPEDVAEQIAMVIEPKLLIPLFNERIIATKGKTIAGVGSVHIKPEYFRIDVEIDPSNLKLQQIKSDDKIGIPLDELSLRLGLNATAASDFESGNSDEISLRHKVVFGYGRTYAQWDGSFARARPYEVENISASYNKKLTTYTVGLLNTRGLNFASSEYFAGFEIMTNLRPLERSALSQGSKIDIFIPSDSKVAIYKNNKIIFSRLLDFGLQEIDTTNFPPGSYEIRMKITDSNGNETEETRMFHKSTALLPKGIPVWTLQAGILRERVDVLNKPIYQAGVEWRLNDIIQLNSFLYGSDDFIIFEPEILGFWGDYRFDAAFAISSEGDTALSSTLYRDGLIDISLTFDKTLTGFNYNMATLDNQDLRGSLTGAQTNISTTLSKGFGAFTLRLDGSITKSGSRPSKFNYGPTLRWQTWKSKALELTTEASRFSTNNGSVGSIFANLRWKPDKKWTLQSKVERYHQIDETSWKLRNSLGYNSRLYDGYGYDVTLSNSADVMHNTRGNYSLTDIRANTQGRYISSRMFARHGTGGGNENSKSVGLELESNLLITEDRKVKIVPEVNGESTFIAEVKGDNVNVEFDILVNNRPRGKVRVGETVALNLMPYKTYEITINPSKTNELIAYDNTAHVVTLYPGNINKKTWEIKKSIMLIGRLIDNKGDPIKWQSLKGMISPSVTDGFGNFQLELTAGEIPYISSSKTKCTMALPQLKTENEYFITIGDIACI